MIDQPENNPHRKGGMIMLIIAWTIIFIGLIWFFSAWSDKQENPNRGLQVQAREGELTLLRNRSGHYITEGEINGEKVTFLLDTGATQVALSKTLARKLKLKLRGNVSLQTANGMTAGSMTRLDSVRIGTIEQRDVSAVVTDGIDDGMVLLGMSFLKKLEILQKNDKLILKTNRVNE
jgi:aspartyl protease family protein